MYSLPKVALNSGSTRGRWEVVEENKPRVRGVQRILTLKLTIAEKGRVREGERGGRETERGI